MSDRDDRWVLEEASRAEKAGILRAVLRNVGMLLAVCLLAVWAIVGFIGGSDTGPSGGARQDQQVSATRKPPQAVRDGGYELAIPLGENGHFVVNAMVNGSEVRFVIDTGASGILLTLEDARRAGIHPATLDYSGRGQTANGEISVARTSVREIRIAGLIVDDMEVWVNRAPMPISLLGMTFLNRLASYEAGNNRLILRW